jgi:hypothetical protein
MKDLYSEKGRKASHVYVSADTIFLNGYVTKSNLEIQCNPHHNSNDILHRAR